MSHSVYYRSAEVHRTRQEVSRRAEEEGTREGLGTKLMDQRVRPM